MNNKTLKEELLKWIIDYERVNGKDNNDLTFEGGAYTLIKECFNKLYNAKPQSDTTTC